MKNKWETIRSDKQHLIKLWILKSLDSPNNPKVLYAYAVPIEGQVSLKKWSSPNPDSQKMDFTIERLSCVISGEDTRKFVDMLETGRTFEEISEVLNLDNPKTYFSKLFFSAEDYRYRPPIFLETSDATMYYSDELRPLSALSMNPCICESLVNVKKLKILEPDDEVKRKELLTFIHDGLAKELPLEILGLDSQRMGNFEIFNFAYESSYDIEPLESSLIKAVENGQEEGDAVRVSIKPGFFKGKIYLRCRTRNGNMIIGDQLRLIKNGNVAQDVTFRILEKSSEMEVSVWDAKEELRERLITLLYEHRVSLMRSMGFTIHLAAIQGRLEIQWTKRMENKSGNKSIKNEFSRLSRSYSSFGGFEEGDVPEEQLGNKNRLLLAEDYKKK